MKILATLALAASALMPAWAHAGVGVSIGISQPGVYGRIDIGGYPAPQLVYPRPMVIRAAPVAVYQQPIYMYVPPVYQSNWGRYCGRYNACGQPVYFVQERWVHDHYRPGRPHYRNDGWRDGRPHYRNDGWRDGRPGRGDWHDGRPGRGHWHDR